jgi:hypothetical protein
MTGLCQRPIMHNRTRPVIPGAYWTVTGRYLHRIRSCDQRVRSSREKRISPFLTICSDLARFSFPSQSAANLAEFPCAAISPSHRTSTVPSLPCPAAVPSSPALAPCLRATLPRTRSPLLAATAPPRHHSSPAPPPSGPPPPSSAPLERPSATAPETPAAASPNSSRATTSRPAPTAEEP